MSAFLDFIAVFYHSDVAGPSPVWWHWINAQCAHAVLGALVRTHGPRWWFSFIILFAAKELFGDIPNGNWSGLVILDSATDLFAAFLGYRYLGPTYSKRPFLKRS